MRDYFLNGWVEVTLNLSGLISGILIARYLGPAGRGQLAAALMWPTTIGVLLGFGLSHAFAYAGGVGWASPAQLKRFGARFTLLITIPAIAVYWYLCPWIFQTQFPEQVWVPRIFSVQIPLTLFAGLLLPIYQGRGEFSRWNIGRLIRAGLWTVGVVLLTIIGALSVFNLLFMQVVILGVLSLYLLSRFHFLTPTLESPFGIPFRRIFKYGLAIYISSIAYTVNQQLDQLLLSVWVGPAELGQYAAAAAIAGLLLIVPSSVGPIVFSKLARSSGDVREQHRHMRRALLSCLVFLIPAGVLVATVAPQITRLVYGDAYLEAGRLLRVLAPAVIFLGIGYTISDVLRGTGKPELSTYGVLLGAALTIAGLIWALPRFGVWGAAWVSLSAYAAMMIVQGVLLWRVTRAAHGTECKVAEPQ